MVEKKEKRVVSNQPDAEALVLTTLYKSGMRSADLVRLVKREQKLSDPSVYLILKRLEKEGFISKIEKSSRNVHYELVPESKKIVEEEYLKARDTLIFAVQSTPNHNEIMAEIIVSDILGKLGPQWQNPSRRKLLIKVFANEVEAIIERTIKLLEICG